MLMNFSEEKVIDVTGLGNALMDLLVEADEALFTATNLTKGNMYLVDEDEAKRLLTGLKDVTYRHTPGGAAANTI